jgi:hypothetical protein
LHDDHADRVRDDVVQLAGDSDPLLGDGEPRLLLALSLEALGAMGQQRGLGPLASQGEADAVGGSEHEPGRHGVLEPAASREQIDEIAGEESAAAERARDECSTAVSVGAEGVEDDEEGEPMLERRLVGARFVDQYHLEPDGHEHDRKHDGRSAPPPRDGNGDKE